MFTDIYFTNLTPLSANDTRIAFFQKNVARTASGATIFKVIQKCQYGWSHVVRIPWDLSFRFVKQSGNTTPVYPIKTIYKPGNKKFLISKEGIVTVKQDYGNGKQIIDFEQVRGSAFSGVQFYRGKFLIGELYFIGKHLNFQIDTLVTVTESYGKNELDTMDVATPQPVAALDIDLTGIKSVYLSINKKSTNKLLVQKVEQW